MSTFFSKKLLLIANIDYHIKAHLDRMQRSRDDLEPSPNKFTYITTPAYLAQGLSQKRKNKLSIARIL